MLIAYIPVAPVQILLNRRGRVVSCQPSLHFAVWLPARLSGAMAGSPQATPVLALSDMLPPAFLGLRSRRYAHRPRIHNEAAQLLRKLIAGNVRQMPSAGWPGGPRAFTNTKSTTRTSCVPPPPGLDILPVILNEFYETCGTPADETSWPTMGTTSCEEFLAPAPKPWSEVLTILPVLPNPRGVDIHNRAVRRRIARTIGELNQQLEQKQIEEERRAGLLTTDENHNIDAHRKSCEELFKDQWNKHWERVQHRPEQDEIESQDSQQPESEPSPGEEMMTDFVSAPRYVGPFRRFRIDKFYSG